MKIKYDRPPINEVVAGFTIQALDKWFVPHFGLLWQRFRDEFPTCEHAPPIADPNGNLVVDLASGAPLPRVWLVGKEPCYLVQLQTDRIYFNWRQTAASDVYPGFDDIFPRLTRVIAVFEDFVREEFGLPVEYRSAELTYVNVFGAEAGWKKAGSLGNVFTDFVWNDETQRSIPAPDLASWQCQFPGPGEKGTLTCASRVARRVTDQAELIKFELVAKALTSSQRVDEIWPWFHEAHDSILLAFSALTHSDVQQKVWGRRT